jgi:hypothetical protein
MASPELCRPTRRKGSVDPAPGSQAKGVKTCKGSSRFCRWFFAGYDFSAKSADESCCHDPKSMEEFLCEQTQ